MVWQDKPLLIHNIATQDQIGSLDELVFLIGGQVALIHAVIGFVIPLFVVTLLTRFFGANRSWREGI